MSPVLGENVPLQIMKDGIYTDYACITDCGVDFSTETIETRTVGDGYHAKPAGQSLSYQVTGSGLIELQETFPVAFWLLTNYQQQMLPVQFRMLFEDPGSGLVKYVSGTALITNLGIVAGSTGFATADFTMAGIGAITISNTPTNCAADIGYMTITDSEAGQITVAYDFVIDAVRFDYTIDGGDRESIFDPGTSGSFAVVGIADGPHTLMVYPICENGNDGFPQELTFEVTGGGADVCDPPTDLSMGAVDSDSAIASWNPPTPTPADGFEWELYTQSNLVTPVDSGTFSGDSLPLSDLMAGTDYFFRVRSICGEDSLSGWTSVSFSTEAASGANAVSYGLFTNGNTGSMAIKKNGVLQVFTGSDVDNAFFAVDGDMIEITATRSGPIDIHVIDTTSSTIIINHDTGSGTMVRSFTTASGHNYNIDVTFT